MGPRGPQQQTKHSRTCEIHTDRIHYSSGATGDRGWFVHCYVKRTKRYEDWADEHRGKFEDKFGEDEKGSPNESIKSTSGTSKRKKKETQSIKKDDIGSDVEDKRDNFGSGKTTD